MKFMFCYGCLLVFSLHQCESVPVQPDLSGKLPALAPVLKEKLAKDISFKAKELQLVCDWIHDDVFKRQNISVAFVFDHKDLMKAPVSLEMKKGDTYEMLLSKALMQNNAKHSVYKDQYILVEPEKPKAK